MRTERVVLDTNILISAMLSAESPPGLALDRVTRGEALLVSKATLAELVEVAHRAKFDKFVSSASRSDFLSRIADYGEVIAIIRVVHACRDPKDDKFLEVAVNGDASCIVTGDQDLLALHPFRGIDILTARTFLDTRIKSG